MEAIGLFLTKFSDELLSAQIALLSCSLALGVYWMLVRKKKRETAEWVPAALVKAYLDRMRTDEHETRVRLFGENSGYAPAAPVTTSLTQQLSAAVAPSQATQMVVSNDPALLKEIEALRSQLTTADQRAMEFDRNLNGLKAEKGALEQKLKEAQAAAAAAPAGDSGAATAVIAKELEEAKAKLAEYEVIEDDLANLKKLQKENEQLKQQLAGAGGGAQLTVVQGGAAPAAEATKVASVTEKIETPVTVVPAAAPEPAPTPAAPEANTNVLAPVTPTAEKSSKQKEEELLSEFEKMLAS